MSEAQYLVALARANEVRLGRATIKREISAGETLLADALREQHPYLVGMPVRELLMSVRGLGARKADQTIGLCSLRPGTKVGNLGAKTQKQILAVLLERWPAVGRRGVGR